MRAVCCMIVSPSQYNCRALRLPSKRELFRKAIGHVRLASMRTRVYRSTDPSPPTAEQETAVCLRIARRHAPVKALQRPLDDPLDCPVRPTHTSIDRNGHRACHFPHSCTSSGGRVGAGCWTALSKDGHPPSRHDARASARPTRRMLSVGGTASSGVARNGGGSTYGRSAEDEHQPHATLRSDVGQRSPPSTTDIPAWLVALRLHVEHLERLPTSSGAA